MIKNILFLVLLSLPVSGICQTKAIQFKGLNRKYILYLPKGYSEDKAYPIVFNFHGGGMTPAEQMLYTNMNRTADRYGFIVVYPKGINEDWNVGFGMPYKNGVDDIGFIDALLSHLEKEHKIVKDGVFATGLSRGGFFCHRIAAELSHRFSAIASIGANLPDSVAFHHKGKGGVSVLLVNGKLDKVVNYAGKQGSYFSANGTYNYWKDHLFPKDDTIRTDKTRTVGAAVSILEAGGLNKKISLITIADGGHTWPGADDFNIGLPIGPTSKEININELMWTFFTGR